MKSILKFIVITLLFFTINLKSANKLPKDSTICFRVEMDCMSCKLKIEKNITFEKGVMALDVDLKSNVVKDKYNKLKNTPQQRKQSIENLKYKVDFIEK